MDPIQRKKLLPVLITALVWDINFRFTFKNIDGHMDLGSYPTLKYDPMVILIKNVSCAVIFFSIYFIYKKINSTKEPDTFLVIAPTERKFIYKKENEKKYLLGSLIRLHNLNSKKKQFWFSVKILLLILIIYIFEEIYLIIGNTHILDRLNVPMRNLSVLITIFLFSSLLIKKNFIIYRHQLVPSLIVIGSSLFIIIFNATSVTRFNKVFGVNFFYYIILYILMGIEIVLTKYLTDVQFINTFVILGLKGIFGTIAFIFVNIYFGGDKLFYFADQFMVFEYDNMYEDFSIELKIFYIISVLIFLFLKLYIINEYSENHFLSVAMIADVFFFPLYFIEKFAVQQFPITTSSTFYLNIIFGIMNATLLLIFNEIIELKCCGFNKNLKKNIEKRKMIEMNNYARKNDNSEEFESFCETDNSVITESRGISIS